MIGINAVDNSESKLGGKTEKRIPISADFLLVGNPFNHASFPKSAEEVMRAFKKAYPRRVKEVALRGGDWALQIDNTWFYWAGGRLLPEEILDQSQKYSAHPFYPYEKELPPIPVYTEEEKKEIEERIAEREENPPQRHPGIYNALWRVKDQQTSYERVKDLYFLGKKIQIHRDLLEELASIEEEILEKAKTDREINNYLSSIDHISAYVWRLIAGTNSLSTHAYGIAVDLIPKDLKHKITYWRWAKDYYPEWYSLPYEKRFMPPPFLIRAFEKRGFVWGGKWFYFDTFHFEYRPEILLLNGWDLD
jgi:hypothetical protein